MQVLLLWGMMKVHHMQWCMLYLLWVLDWGRSWGLVAVAFLPRGFHERLQCDLALLNTRESIESHLNVKVVFQESTSHICWIKSDFLFIQAVRQNSMIVWSLLRNSTIQSVRSKMFLGWNVFRGSGCFRIENALQRCCLLVHGRETPEIELILQWRLCVSIWYCHRSVLQLFLCCQTSGRTGPGVKGSGWGTVFHGCDLIRTVQTELTVCWKGECLSFTESDLSSVWAHCDPAQFSD